MLAIHSMQLQKEVKSNPAVKKVWSSEEGHCEKRCEIQGGRRLVMKILIMTILVYLKGFHCKFMQLILQPLCNYILHLYFPLLKSWQHNERHMPNVHNEIFVRA